MVLRTHRGGLRHDAQNSGTEAKQGLSPISWALRGGCVPTGTAPPPSMPVSHPALRYRPSSSAQGDRQGKPGRSNVGDINYLSCGQIRATNLTLGVQTGWSGFFVMVKSNSAIFYWALFLQRAGVIPNPGTTVLSRYNCCPAQAPRAGARQAHSHPKRQWVQAAQYT